MTAAVYPAYGSPPPLYRAARALRRASLLVLVVLIVFTASVAYSAVLTAKSSSHLGAFSESFAANGTLVLNGGLTLHNDGFYSVQGLTVSVRLTNTSGAFVGAARLGPTDLASQGSATYPLTLYVPVSGAGAGPSLLTQDQSLPVSVWANATFGYLFPVSLTISTTRSWGAPFADLVVSVGAPTVNASGTYLPVLVSFQNHAPIADAGLLEIALVASGGTRCGSGGFALNVPPGTPYSGSSQVMIVSGCSPAGGTVQPTFVTPGYAVALPTEPIP